MPVYDDPLAVLAAQVRRGDAGAVCGLRDELEPRLARAVRQVLRTGSDTSPLDRRILKELSGAPRPGDRRGRRQLACRVARRLCAQVIAGLQRDAPAAEALKDTVRDF